MRSPKFATSPLATRRLLSQRDARYTARIPHCTRGSAPELATKSAAGSELVSALTSVRLLEVELVILWEARSALGMGMMWVASRGAGLVTPLGRPVRARQMVRVKVRLAVH